MEEPDSVVVEDLAAFVIRPFQGVDGGEGVPDESRSLLRIEWHIGPE
jgi:hypothetical protein